MPYPTRMYIAGELVHGEGTIDVENPATGSHFLTVEAAGLRDVKRALAAAKAAFPAWAATSIPERQVWMRRLRDAVMAAENRLRDCIHHEMGKPWAATKEDFDSLVNALDFYSEEIARLRDETLPDRTGTHDHRLVHEPVGVVVAYLAWNFPLLNLAFKIGPALAAGCPIIIRPSEETPVSAYALGEICHRIGLPPGVVQILCTDGYDVADAISASDIPAMITLIGSTRTGTHIMRAGASTIKRYSMELGGNAPAIVFADADLDVALDTISALKIGNAGQICVAPNRIFVERGVAGAFTEGLVERAGAARIGWDRSDDIACGPVINAKAWERLKRLVDDAVAQGARLLVGGDRPAALPYGHFFSPTVVTCVTDHMDLYRNEIFGPIFAITEFDDRTDVLAKANDCGDGGLTAYVFTEDSDRSERLARTLRYGEIQINGVKYGIDLPHGGIGQSGIGHDCSYLALRDYTVLKRISRAIAKSTP